MATRWEYCVLTRMSNGPDTKWYVNRIFHHTAVFEALEVTDKAFRKYNEVFEKFHNSRHFPILPAVLNVLGADGWELIDDMNTGLLGGEGLVFKRPVARQRKAAAKKPARRK
jgi:hypothetical protein